MNANFGLFPSWQRRAGFLCAGTLVAFASAWAGTESGLTLKVQEQAQREQLSANLAAFNQGFDAAPAAGDRWEPIDDLHWLGLEMSVRHAGLTPVSSTVKMSELPKNPAEAKPLLKGIERRWIEVDIGNQRLTAWEGNRAVRTVAVSTGKAATPTRVGVWTIHRKVWRDRMRGPGYDVPNVPYAMYYDGGYALHGAYWHNNFGTPMSHGCTNLSVPQARWLYEWAPNGTPVVLH